MSVAGESSIAAMEAKVQELELNLSGWIEPNGFLVPTEPNVEERELIRRDLRTALVVMRMAIGIVQVHR